MRMKSAKRELMLQTKPSLFLDYRLYFSAVYQYLKRGNDSYTYQTFAKDLGFSATTIMHQIIKGYRPLTHKSAEKIGRTIGLDRHEQRYLLALVEFCNAKTTADREDSFTILTTLKRELLPSEVDKDMMSYFSEWYHPVIWELIGAEGFRADLEWIQDKIFPRLQLSQIEDSFTLLENLKFISRTENGWVQLHNRISTGPQMLGHALMSYHQNMLDHAKRAIIEVKSDRRDVSAITVSVSEESAGRLRELIHAFQKQLLDEAERSENRDQIYQINIQLFPFTR